MMLEGNFEGVWYHWSCGHCAAMNESENDVRDSEVECDLCGRTNLVKWSM